MTFFKDTLYLINIFLYFISLYIINGIISLPRRHIVKRINAPVDYLS